MDALELLTQRNSANRLGEPGPSRTVLAQMFACALRVPDHGRLQPWRFLTIEGESRNRLGALFVDALQMRKPDAAEEEIAKARLAPLRAPLIVAVIARIQTHPKVPAIEQTLSAGCCAHALVLAAQALGFGAIWRTGDFCYDPFVQQRLGLSEAEHLVGYIYIGTPTTPAKPVPMPAPEEFVTAW